MKLFKLSRLLTITIIILLGVITYANSFKTPFVLDDIDGILRNPLTTNLGVIPHIRAHTLRFIPYYSFALNYYFGGWKVWGYHLVNLILHIANTLLLFYFLRLVQKTQSKNSIVKFTNDLIPFITALLFLVNPIQTQAVTYISQRITLMATLFYLSTMILFLQATLFKFRLKPYIFSIITMCAALICKEISFTLPITLLILSFFFSNAGSWKKKVLLVFPFFALPIIIYISVLVITNSNILTLLSLPSGTPSLSRSEYILTQMNVIRTYIRLLLFPIKQNLDYDYRNHAGA